MADACQHAGAEPYGVQPRHAVGTELRRSTTDFTQHAARGPQPARHVGQFAAPDQLPAAEHPAAHTVHFAKLAGHVTQHASRLTQHASNVTQHAGNVTQHASDVAQYASHVTQHARSDVADDSRRDVAEYGPRVTHGARLSQHDATTGELFSLKSYFEFDKNMILF